MAHAMTGIKQLNWEKNFQNNLPMLIADELEMSHTRSTEG